jgi:hypothetical protein
MDGQHICTLSLAPHFKTQRKALSEKTIDSFFLFKWLIFYFLFKYVWSKFFEKQRFGILEAIYINSGVPRKKFQGGMGGKPTFCAARLRRADFHYNFLGFRGRGEFPPSPLGTPLYINHASLLFSQFDQFLQGWGRFETIFKGKSGSWSRSCAH